MKTIKFINKIVMLSILFIGSMVAKPPKNMYLGVKNKSSVNIFPIFMNEMHLDKIFKAQGWTKKSSDIVLDLSNKVIDLAKKVELKKGIITKYKAVKDKIDQLEVDLSKEEKNLIVVENLDKEIKDKQTEIETANKSLEVVNSSLKDAKLDELKKQLDEQKKNLDKLKPDAKDYQPTIEKITELEGQISKIASNQESKKTFEETLKNGSAELKDLLTKQKTEKPEDISARIVALKNQIGEEKTTLGTGKSEYEKAMKIELGKQSAEDWIKTGQDAVKAMGDFVSSWLPDAVVAGIKAKDPKRIQMLFPTQHKYITKAESSLKDPKMKIVFAVFPEHPKYTGLPDFTKLLFLRSIEKDEKGEPKFNYIEYLGDGKALFRKYGKDDEGVWTVIEQKEKIYPPMSLTSKGQITGSAEGQALINEQKAEEKKVDEQAEEIFEL